MSEHTDTLTAMLLELSNCQMASGESPPLEIEWGVFGGIGS